MDWTLFWTIIWQVLIALGMLTFPVAISAFIISSAVRK